MVDFARPTSLEIAPACTLRDVARRCYVDEPLASGDPRWQDFSGAPGDDGTEAIARELARRPVEGGVHMLLMGASGAGKSTALLRLMERLGSAYCCVYLDATVEMNRRQIDVEDLLLNIATAVEAHVRAIGKPLPEEVLTRVRRWFEETVSTCAWAKDFNHAAAAGISGRECEGLLGGLVASAKALLREDSEYRTEVKRVLQRFPGTMLQSVNVVLEAAGRELGDRSLLVVIDNLDRYSPEVIDRILVDGADRIRALECNLILTPPIGLMLQPQSAQLDSLYSCHVLYTVCLRRPDQGYGDFDGPGRDLMEHALRRRIDLDTMIPDRAARDRLIAASGGAIRELLDLVSKAAYLADGEVIGRDDVERAVALRKQRLRDIMHANGWVETLRWLAREKPAFPGEEGIAAVFHRLAFTYAGRDWYDLHPLVAELPELRREARSAVS